jgi:dynein heavy chain
MNLRTQPDYAGSAYWAKSLLQRVQSSMNSLSNAYYLPQSSLMVEAKAQYEVITSSLEDYISKTHQEWVQSIPITLSEKLNDVLMVRKGDMLQMKFDKDLMRFFAEVNYFQRLKMDIPFHVQELFSKKEELRILRENVLLVVREYNTIMECLTPQEHLLFKERLKFIDRKINPGLTNLNWYQIIYLGILKESLTSL